jgi:hypothetical protein
MKACSPPTARPHSQSAVEAFISRFAWFKQPPAIELVTVHPRDPVRPRRRSGPGTRRSRSTTPRRATRRARRVRAPEGARPEFLARSRLVGDARPEIGPARAVERLRPDRHGTHGQTAIANLVMGLGRGPR